MDSIFSLSPLPNCFAPHRNPPFSIFTANRRIRIQTSASNSPKRPQTPNHPIPIRYIPKALCFPEASTCSKEEERPVLAIERIAKQVLLALVCFGIGFAPFRTAIAAPAVAEAVLDEKEVDYKGEGYSAFTKRLLETVAVLVRGVEKVRAGNGDVKLVEDAWKAVRAKKEELQEEILSGLHEELRKLRRSKEELVKRSDEIVEEVVKVKRDIEKLLRNSGKEEVKERVERMEERVERLEEEYSGVWERVGEIEDEILSRETLALSYGVRELCFIERECEQLVQNFTRQMRRKSVERYCLIMFMFMNSNWIESVLKMVAFFG